MTLRGLSGVVSPLSSQRPHYLCCLLLINSLPSVCLEILFQTALRLPPQTSLERICVVDRLQDPPLNSWGQGTDPPLGSQRPGGQLCPYTDNFFRFYSVKSPQIRTMQHSPNCQDPGMAQDPAQGDSGMSPIGV